MQASAPRRFAPRGVGPAASVTPALQSQVAAGPTVLIEDSHMFQTPMGSQVPAAPRPQRARMLVLTPEAEAEALQLTNEGKITSKNAWSIKLLEGIHDSVAHALAAGGTGNTGSSQISGGVGSGPSGGDDMSLASQFTKCANLVEGGAKIWTHRVEHTAVWSTQVLRRLQRNDEKGAAEEDGEEAAANGEGGEGQSKKPEKIKRKVERTVAECLSEINLDEKSKALTMSQSGGVSAQFRAITEKFEQGNAQGLLLNNAPMGAAGNLILDVDYAKLESESEAVHKGNLATTLGESFHNVVATARSGAGGAVSASFQSAVASVGELLPSPSKRPRLSTSSLAHEALTPPQPSPRGSRLQSTPGGVKDEQLDEIDEGQQRVLLEPPGAQRSWGSIGSNISSSDLIGRGSGKRTAKGGSTPFADELYISNIQGATPQQLLMTSINTTKAEDAAIESPPRTSQRLTQGSAEKDLMAAEGREDVEAYGELEAGEIGDADEDEDEPNWGLNASGTRRGISRSVGGISTTSRAVSSVRDLVSGAADLAFFDSAILGDQLAIAVDSPNTWFPMSQTEGSGNAFGHRVGGGPTGGGLLDQIRREKQLPTSQASEGGDAASGAPKKKRTRSEKQVVVVADGIEVFLTPSEVTSISSSENKLMCQRRENLKRPIPDFRERFLFRKSCEVAKEHHLLLPDTTSKGALPWWLPADCATSVAAFFQPFSTPNLNWNILNKRVTTMDEAYRLQVAGVGTLTGGRPSGAHPAAGDGGANGAGGDAPNMVHEMPLHVFDDDMEGYDGADLGGDGAMDDDDGGDYAAHFDLTAARNSLLAMNQFADTAAADEADDGTMLAAEEQLEVMERPEVLNVLQTRHATIPTQVDVVRLRRVMWHQMQRVMSEKPTVVMLPRDLHGEEAGNDSRNTFGKKKPLKRDRDQTANTDENTTMTPAFGDNGDYVATELYRFSEVVAGVLAHANSISATGTLSPAFLFFSLLFLTNEHGIQLENVPGDVQDVYIRGLIGDSAPNLVAH